MRSNSQMAQMRWKEAELSCVNRTMRKSCVFVCICSVCCIVNEDI